MKQLLRVSALVLLMAVLITALASCGRVYASPRAGRVVATVGDVEVLYEEYYFIAQNRIDELKAEGGEGVLDDPAVLADLDAFVWERILQRDKALVSLGYSYGLNVYDGDLAENVDAYLSSVKEGEYGGDRGAYIDGLQQMHMTEHYARSYFGVQHYLANAIVLEMLYRGELETDDAAVLARLQGADFIRTAHVFISKTDGNYTVEEDRAHANELHATISAATTNQARYDALNRAIGGKYNTDFSDLTGDGHYFARGEMTAAYEAAAFALAEYELSPVIETEDGFYLIMRLPKSEAYIKENLQSLKENAYFVVLNQKVEERMATLTLEKTKLGASLDLRALPDIDANGGSTLLLVCGIVGGVLVIGGVLLLVMRAVKKKKSK